MASDLRLRRKEGADGAVPQRPGADPIERARVAVVVLNYRTPDLALDCLATLRGDLDPERDTVVVVDNASGDGSADRIRDAASNSASPRAIVVEAPSNAGFAAGNNLGIRSVAAEAYLLLNSDTLVRPGAVETLWQALQQDPEVGVVSPRLEWPDGTPQISCFRLHTPWSQLIAGSATGPIRSLLSRWDVPIPVQDQPFAPEWVSFAAVMIRRDVLDKVGLLDEGFFMYFEDADFCRRAGKAGWKIWHEPRARVVHLRGKTSPVKALSQARKRRPGYYYASRSRYFRNAFGPFGWLAANAMWTLGFVVALAREWLERKPRPHVERELLDLWTH